MKHFTIENETNNITVHGSAEAAEAVVNAERFRNEAGLAKVAADWPMARLVEIWNGLPGAEPIKKFKDRATAVSRIWKAIQMLGGTAPEPETPVVPEAAVGTDVAPQSANVAPAEPASEEQATPAETPGETALLISRNAPNCCRLRPPLRVLIGTRCGTWRRPSGSRSTIRAT
jgi:hypothetical protein